MATGQAGRWPHVWLAADPPPSSGGESRRVLSRMAVQGARRSSAAQGTAVGKRGERFPSTRKRGPQRSSEPSALWGAAGGAAWARGRQQGAPALAGGQESLLVPGEQEAVEEVDGTLAVLLGLLRHQVGWRPQEEAGEQGGCGGRAGYRPGEGAGRGAAGRGGGRELPRPYRSWWR